MARCMARWFGWEQLQKCLTNGIIPVMRVAHGVLLIFGGSNHQESIPQIDTHQCALRANTRAQKDMKVKRTYVLKFVYGSETRARVCRSVTPWTTNGGHQLGFRRSGGRRGPGPPESASPSCSPGCRCVRSAWLTQWVVMQLS